jgi:hypothetical protein
VSARRAPRGRLPLYAATNLGFVVLVAVLAAMGHNGNPRLLYLMALFAICSSPILLADKLNGRYTLLCVLAPLFFFFYGAGDLLDMAMPSTFTTADAGALNSAEIAILIGIGVLVAGYRAAVWLGRHRKAPRVIRDWSGTSLLLVGVLLWSIGVAANWIWQIEVQRRAFGPMQELGTLQSLALVAARLLQPLGTVLVSYRVIAFRNRPLLLLILAMLAVELLVGFLGDSKELALRGVAIVVLCRCLIEGRVPKLWIAAAGLFVVLSFPVFQAYRSEVLSHGNDRGHAAQNLTENLAKAFNSHKLESGQANYSSRSFLARSSLKPTMEMILAKVGDVAPYQHGYTVALTLMGLVPRALWPEKPDTSTGQLFNRELHISEFRDVYISVSQLGELYWNFGWLGVVVGMGCIGLLLGTVNSRCDLSEGRSVTRLLVIVVTAYLVCVRFEDNIAMAYIQWLRSLIAVGGLHLLFARRTVVPGPQCAARTPAAIAGPPRQDSRLRTLT